MARTYHVPALEKALAILDYVSQPASATSTEIHTALDLPKATTFMILSVLERHRMVKRSTDNRYSIGVRAYELGMRYLAGLDIVDTARPHVGALMERTRLTSHLGVIEGSRLIYADKVEPGGMIRFSTFVGMTADLHTSSLGKAILASMSDRDARDLVDRIELGRYTPNTLTDRHTLLEELRRTRDRGYSIEDEEGELGVRCVGAPILDASGQVVAAVSVTGVLSQIPPERIASLGADVMLAANDISRELGSRSETTVPALAEQTAGGADAHGDRGR